MFSCPSQPQHCHRRLSPDCAGAKEGGRRERGGGEGGRVEGEGEGEGGRKRERERGNSTDQFITQKAEKSL